MSSPEDRIAPFRKMATDDPTSEIAHYRLGQELMKVGQYEEAAGSFRRALELMPHFSRCYLLLAQCQKALGFTAEALQTAEAGYKMASERGDNVPREELGKLIGELGGTVPAAATTATPATEPAPGGFRCQRPNCMYGAHAQPLDGPPLPDEVGRQIQARVCAGCWNDWFRNYSIKVINELRLDLSSERGQAEYDRYMREFLGLDEPEGQALPQA